MRQDTLVFGAKVEQTRATELNSPAPHPLDALVPLLCCPVTGEWPLLLHMDTAEEGVLTSPSGRVYPILGGIPRLLPPDLLRPLLEARAPDVLRRMPAVAAWLQVVPAPDPEVLSTLTGYGLQHVDMADDEFHTDDERQTWERFQPGLPPESFAGETVLEVGCGDGRHACLVSPHARMFVGLDLSRSVELCRQRDRGPRSFYVQGDLRRPPFRPGAFDAMYSNGVLHHTPVPAESCAAVARCVRSGGRVSVWVYGLNEMRWSYRMSHMRWLRPLTNRLSRPAQVAAATLLAGCLEASLWTPARLLKHAGLDGLAARVPLEDAAGRPWKYKVRRTFDRFNPPITHYPSRADLSSWFEGHHAVRIVDTDGRGWSAQAVRP